jgi:hypothetical protein
VASHPTAEYGKGDTGQITAKNADLADLSNYDPEVSITKWIFRLKAEVTCLEML